MGLIVQNLHASQADFQSLLQAEALVRPVSSGIGQPAKGGDDATDPRHFPKFTLFPRWLLVKIGA
jgi:hypothetical protein